MGTDRHGALLDANAINYWSSTIISETSLPRKEKEENDGEPFLIRARLDAVHQTTIPWFPASSRGRAGFQGRPLLPRSPPSPARRM